MLEDTEFRWGCSFKIAYQWALDEGFEKIIIIKTRERGFRKPVKGIGRLTKFYRKISRFSEISVGK